MCVDPNAFPACATPGDKGQPGTCVCVRGRQAARPQPSTLNSQLSPAPTPPPIRSDLRCICTDKLQLGRGGGGVRYRGWGGAGGRESGQTSQASYAGGSNSSACCLEGPLADSDYLPTLYLYLTTYLMFCVCRLVCVDICVCMHDLPPSLPPPLTTKQSYPGPTIEVLGDSHSQWQKGPVRAQNHQLPTGALRDAMSDTSV